MISVFIGSLAEEDLVKSMVAGKQTLEKCKLLMFLCFARNSEWVLFILHSEKKKIPVWVSGNP